MKNILGTGLITITDLSDPIISSTAPPTPVEDMLWLDISKTPPVLMVYKDNQWIAVSDTGSLPDSVPVGGYFGGDFLINQSETGIENAGEIKVNSGIYVHPDGSTYVIPNYKAIYTGCEGREGNVRYILFIGSDSSRFTFSVESASRHFVETVYKNKEWYYFVNDKIERRFEISQKDCIVAKIEEYTSLDTSNGIKNIIKYYEDKETVFEALTDGGKNQAIYKKNGLLYINAEFIKAGKIASLNGMSEFDLENGALRVGQKTNNHLIFDGNELSIKASKITIGASSVATNDDIDSAVNEGINNLQIGGRNLIIDTSKTFQDIKVGQWNGTVGRWARKHCSEYGLKVGDIITFSLEINAINKSKLGARIDFYSEPTGEVGKTTYGNENSYVTKGNTKVVYVTATIPQGKEYIQLFIYNRNSSIDTTTTTEKYRYDKLEIGNKATSWSPAPEDIDSNMQGIKDNLANNYSTTVQMNSAIEQKASGILSTVNATYTTKTDFDNMQIGGRNLIIRHNELKDKMIDTNGAVGTLAVSSLMLDFIKVTPGETLLFSQIENTGGDNYFRYAFYAENKTTVIKRTPNNAMKFKEVVPSGAYWLRVSYDSNNIVKIEKGTKYTDWSPAPEDIDGNIEGIKNNLANNYSTTTQMNSTIEQKASGILSTVSTTYTTKADFNNMQIGGRNLLKGTSSEYENYSTAQYYTSVGDFLHFSDFNLKNGDVLIFKVYLKPDSTKGARARISYYFGDGTKYRTHLGNIIENGSEGYSEIKVTLSDIADRMWCAINSEDTSTTESATGYFKEAKLENATKSSAWTPSPEDVDDSMSDTANKINGNIDSAVNEAKKDVLDSMSKNYASLDNFNSLSEIVSSNFNQTSKDISMQFETAQSYTKEVDGKLQEFQNTVATNIRFSENGIDLGKTNSPFTATLDNEKLAFKQDGEEVAYISNNKMYITQAEIKNNLRMGTSVLGFFTWIQGNDGNLSLKWSEG